MSKIFSGLKVALQQQAVAAARAVDKQQTNILESHQFSAMVADLQQKIVNHQSVKDAIQSGALGPISPSDIEAFLRRANDRFFSQESKKLENRSSTKASGTKADDDGSAIFDIELELESFFTGGRHMTNNVGASITSLEMAEHIHLLNDRLNDSNYRIWPTIAAVLVNRAEALPKAA